MGAPRPQSPPPDPRQRPVLRLAAHGQRAEVLPGVIRLGLGLSVQHPPGDSQAERFRDHVEQVRLARAVGFDLVFASQHYLSHPFTYFQPFPTLGRIAAEADGMTIGTGILLLPLHQPLDVAEQDRKSTRLNSSHLVISYAVFCLKKKNSFAIRTFHGRMEPAPKITAAARRDPRYAHY